MTKSIHDEILDEAIEDANNSKEEKAKPFFTPIKIIASLIIILMMILWIVPYYAVKTNPEPKEILELDQIIDVNGPNNLHDLVRPTDLDYRAYIDHTDPLVKQVATKVVSKGCQDANKVCQSKAIFYFVQQNFIYVAETDEYVQMPQEMLYTGGGDCDDFTVLTASMMKAIGVPVQLVRTQNHLYLQIHVEEAPNRYKDEGWITLDPTCKECKYGEEHWKYSKVDKTYLYA